MFTDNDTQIIGELMGGWIFVYLCTYVLFAYCNPVKWFRRGIQREI